MLLFTIVLLLFSIYFLLGLVSLYVTNQFSYLVNNKYVLFLEAFI